MEKKEIMLLFGYPITGIEYCDENVEFAFKNAENVFSLFNRKNKIFYLFRKKINKKIWVEQYAIATLKEILGRIRSKFSGTIPLGDNNILTLEYKHLLDEAQSEKNKLINLIN